MKECYGDYAYVYLSDTSVYNVTLGNVSSTYSTPNLQRYVFALPDGKDCVRSLFTRASLHSLPECAHPMLKQTIAAADESKADLQPIDIIVIVAVALFIAAGAFVLLRTMCTKVHSLFECSPRVRLCALLLTFLPVSFSAHRKSGATSRWRERRLPCAP